jgi:hypothetical protein
MPQNATFIIQLPGKAKSCRKESVQFYRFIKLCYILATVMALLCNKLYTIT